MGGLSFHLEVGVAFSARFGTGVFEQDVCDALSTRKQAERFFLLQCKLNWCIEGHIENFALELLSFFVHLFDETPSYFYKCSLVAECRVQLHYCKIYFLTVLQYHLFTSSFKNVYLYCARHAFQPRVQRFPNPRRVAAPQQQCRAQSAHRRSDFTSRATVT